MTDRNLSSDHVRAHLEPRGFEVRELPADTSTAVLAARALDTNVGAIVKSLLFVGDSGPVLVLVAGDRTVDTPRLLKTLGGRSVRLARPAEVLDVTGYRVGGVPPVAHLRPLTTLIDRNLMVDGKLFAAAGAGNAIFAVSAAELLTLTGGRLADFTS